MAREWEQPPNEIFDQRVDGVLYRRYNRKAEAREARKFRREDLTEQDLRLGDTRRFLLDDGYGDLNDIFMEKNNYEGLLD